MIDNKIIRITKENSFNQGWSLCLPFDIAHKSNTKFNVVTVSSIVKLITFANVVNLIISEPCLSSQIINEILWAAKYIKLNIIAKNKSILERYNMFSFNTVKIDEKIDFNYIGITGKNNGHFIINDSYVECDNTIEDIVFNKKSSTCGIDYNLIDTIIFVDKNKLEYSRILEEAKNAKIKVYYVFDYENVSKDLVKTLISAGLTVLTGVCKQNAIISINKDGTITQLIDVGGGIRFFTSIKMVSEFVSNTYMFSGLNDEVNLSRIDNNYFIWKRGKVDTFVLRDSKTIREKLEMTSIEDFFNGNFDKSIVENHNDYSGETKQVIYEFTLIPPIIDNTYGYSKIYDRLVELNKMLSNKYKLDTKKIESDFKKISEGEFCSDLISFLSNFDKTIERINKSIDCYEYSFFHENLENDISQVDYYLQNLRNEFEQMFIDMKSSSSSTQFLKFDDEIAGYNKTIKEKEGLINQGIDVLNNQRRVKMLRDKIANLELLKKSFIKNNALSYENSANQFGKVCESYLNGSKHNEVVTDSIGGVISNNGPTKEQLLDSFAYNWICAINSSLLEVFDILKSMNSIDVPQEYIVYEKNGDKFIAIESECEFYDTRKLRDKYSLNCIVRR